jgi:hypothetical protein
MSSSIALEPEEYVQQYEPPTEALGRIPQVTPATSGGKQIEGDFPLDQVVIDRESVLPEFLPFY